jgi:hypothetical protein
MNTFPTRTIFAFGVIGLTAGVATAQEAPATARVVVYRPFKYFGRGVNYRLWLADQEVCRLSNRRTLHLTVPAGPVALRSRYQDFLSRYPERTLTLNAEAGQTYYVRADAGFWRTVLDLTAVDAATGQNALKSIPRADRCASALALRQP